MLALAFFLLAASSGGPASAETTSLSLEETVAGLFQNPPKSLARIDKDTVSNDRAQFYAVDRTRCVGGTRVPGDDGSVSTEIDGSGPKIEDALPVAREFYFQNAIRERTQIVRNKGSEDWLIEGKGVACSVYHSGRRECWDSASFSRLVPGVADAELRAATVDASVEHLFSARLRRPLLFTATA
jgi:hypothetical protein